MPLAMPLAMYSGGLPGVYFAWPSQVSAGVARVWRAGDLGASPVGGGWDALGVGLLFKGGQRK